MPLNHHRGGTGEPLLLVHGIGSRWQVWEPVLGALQAERDVVAIDRRASRARRPRHPGRRPACGR